MDATRAERVENAIRHCIWQCCLSKMAGVSEAKAIGDIHERGQEGTQDSKTDQVNNLLGRGLANCASGQDDCDELCNTAYLDGMLELK